MTFLHVALGSHPVDWPPAALPILPLPAQAQGEQGVASCLRVSAGGAISLLALNGLFILIHKHNL